MARARIAAKTGQGITRRAYKTANKLGAKGGSPSTGLDKQRVKKPRIYSGNNKRDKNSVESRLSDPIEELTSLDVKRDYKK